MSTHPVMTNALVEAPPNHAFDRFEPAQHDPPAGAGKWPWWTPLCALVIATVLGLPLALSVDPFDFPFGATIEETVIGGLLVGIAYLLAAKFGTRPSLADLGIRATAARAAVGWVLLARFGYAICAAIYIAMAGHVTPNIPVQPVRDITTLDRVDAVIAIVVLAPVFEELFFRGFLYGALRGKLPAFWAALVAGGLFGAAHPIYGGSEWNLVPVLAIAGITLCLLYEKTGSLWPPIAFHALMNAGVIYLVTGDVKAPLYALLCIGGLFLLAPWRWFSRQAPGRGGRTRT